MPKYQLIPSFSYSKTKSINRMATVFDRTMAQKAVVRPGFGKEGRPIDLFANFYRMKFNPRITVYHYDIEIEPKCPKFLKRKLIHKFAQDNKAKLFQSKSIF